MIHGLENLTDVILLGTYRSRADSKLVFRLFHMVLTGVLVELIDIILSVSLYTSLCSISRLTLFQQYILRDCFLHDTHQTTHFHVSLHFISLWLATKKVNGSSDLSFRHIVVRYGG